MKINCILVLTIINFYSLNAQHHYPKSIASEVKIALSHYPELAEVPIEFKFKNKIKKSTMQAQPSSVASVRDEYNNLGQFLL